MSHYHERGGHSHTFVRFPQEVHLPNSFQPSMKVDVLQIEPYLSKERKKGLAGLSDKKSSTIAEIYKKLTPQQRKALATALLITSVGLGLASNSNIAYAATTDCGRDWFDTCLCNGQVVDGDKYCPKDGQQTKSATLPDPASEQHRTGLDREIPGTTAGVCTGAGLLVVGAILLAIFRDLNNDMPN